jgi:hypothetical protein
VLKTHEAFGSHIGGRKTTGLLVRVKNKPGWSVLDRENNGLAGKRKVVSAGLLDAGAHDVVQALCCSQAGRARANDEHVDMSEIYLSVPAGTDCAPYVMIKLTDLKTC